MTSTGFRRLPEAGAELVIFFLNSSEQSLQPISLLEVTQLGRIGRAHVEGKEITIGIELVEGRDKIRHRPNPPALLAVSRSRLAHLLDTAKKNAR